MRFCFLEIAAKGTTYLKTMGNFKKQNFDLPTRRVGMLRGDKQTQRFHPARPTRRVGMLRGDQTATAATTHARKALQVRIHPLFFVFYTNFPTLFYPPIDKVHKPWYNTEK